ncbi:hypothetical protein DPIF89300162_200036 [Tenacibaculum maritimum]|nr:hypothetical protein DPIF89300162_200036 [Tenacibaculum maritimum]
MNLNTKQKRFILGKNGDLFFYNSPAKYAKKSRVERTYP